MNLEQFIKITNKPSIFGSFSPVHRERIVCNDGFNFSAQGGYGMYSNPRSASDRFDELELGYPSDEEELIMEYAETPESPTDTVYGYVPCDIIQKVITKHGGINIFKSFKDINDVPIEYLRKDKLKRVLR